MKQITRINHVGLRVRDLNVAREFYEKLGFEFIAGPIGPEPVEFDGAMFFFIRDPDGNVIEFHRPS